jgi:elongation factor G
MVSYFKVLSGELNAGDELVNAHNGETERLNQLFVAEGKQRTSVDKLVAGDLGVTVRLKYGHSNNTLNAKGVERKVRKMQFPESRIRKAVTTANLADMEKMIKALHQIEEEDLTFKVEQSSELKQTIVYGQGQLHLDLIKHRIESENNIEIIFEEPKVPYRETITKAAKAEYRHKKQSGGAGQFGEVHLTIEPYYDDMPEPQGVNVRNKEIEELPWGGKSSGACFCLSDHSQCDKSCAGLHIS